MDLTVKDKVYHAAKHGMSISLLETMASLSNKECEQVLNQVGTSRNMYLGSNYKTHGYS